MSDLSIRKTAVVLGIQIFGVLVLGELLATTFLFTAIGVITPENLNRDLWGLLGLAVLIKVLLQGYIVMILTYNWTSNRYLVRGHHLVMRHRLLSQDEKLYELSNLQNIRIHQSWIGRLFNFGTLELAFAMPGHVRSMFLVAVHNPRHYADMFERFFEPPGSSQTAHMMNPPALHDGAGHNLHHTGSY